MNEPKRLLAPDGDAATGFERQLLQAVLDERPSEAATQRMLEATLAAGTATVPGAVGMGAGAWLASTAVAVGIAGLAAAVWLGGDGAALDDAAHTRSGTSPVSAANEASNDDAARGGKGSPRPSIDTERNAVTPPTPSLKAGAPEAGALEAGALESAATAETRTGAATTAGRTPRAPADSAAHGDSPAPGESAAPGAAPADSASRTLREEVELLDRARSALRAGDASGTFAALARYDQRFPSGMLRKESAVLRERARALTNGPAHADER